MLDEYFAMRINVADGRLNSIPMILPGWTPNLDKLPLCELPVVAECVDRD